MSSPGEDPPTIAGPTGPGDDAGDAAEIGSDGPVSDVPASDEQVSDEPVSDEEAAPVAPVRRRRSLQAEPKPSLQPTLLSGRSLEAPRPTSRLSFVRENRGIAIAVLVVAVLVAAVLGGKWFAERSADTAMQQQADELLDVLADATPEDFLAFGASVQEDGSLAQQVRDTDGFVNVRARAELAFIRFQPTGWWSGFTERCLVVYVRQDETTVQTPKMPCNRVQVPQG